MQPENGAVVRDKGLKAQNTVLLDDAVGGSGGGGVGAVAAVVLQEGVCWGVGGDGSDQVACEP